MDVFPKAAPYLLSSNSLNSLISPCCYGGTLVTIDFSTDPGFSTSMSLRYLQAVLGFFQNARCITVGRSSPASARVSGPSDLKECMVNVVRSPALRACTFSIFVISDADIGVFSLMGVLVFGRRELLEKRYPCVMFHPSAVPIAMYSSTTLTGHVVIRLVSYSTVIRGSAPSRMSSPIGNQEGGRIHLVAVMCAV